jgi:hypothetical protein
VGFLFALCFSPSSMMIVSDADAEADANGNLLTDVHKSLILLIVPNVPQCSMQLELGFLKQNQ